MLDIWTSRILMKRAREARLFLPRKVVVSLVSGEKSFVCLL